MKNGIFEMFLKDYTVRRIFEDSDDFFASMGLPRMTTSFWEKSMFEDPLDGRVVNCVPPFEWDMALGRGSEDFRSAGHLDMWPDPGLDD